MTSWPRRSLAGALILVGGLGLALGACGPGDDDTPSMGIALATPQALQVDCANAPVDLKAELRITGNTRVCELTVDVDAGTTTGTCPTSRGFVRTLTLDWFVERTAPGGGPVRVVLAQARGSLDFTDDAEAAPRPLFGEPEVETATWTITPDDITVSTCVDVTTDPASTETTMSFEGASVPVCDLDGSCASDPEPDCTNLGQLCATGAAF